jgi:hypothetical protein
MTGKEPLRTEGGLFFLWQRTKMASKISSAAGSAQGDCILKFLEEMLSVFVVPSSPHSLVLRPGIDLLVLFHDRSNEPPNERQVFGCIVGSHLAVVFA